MVLVFWPDIVCMVLHTPFQDQRRILSLCSSRCILSPWDGCYKWTLISCYFWDFEVEIACYCFGMRLKFCFPTPFWILSAIGITLNPCLFFFIFVNKKWPHQHPTKTSFWEFFFILVHGWLILWKLLAIYLIVFLTVNYFSYLKMMK